MTSFSSSCFLNGCSGVKTMFDRETQHNFKLYILLTYNNEHAREAHLRFLRFLLPYLKDMGGSIEML